MKGEELYPIYETFTEQLVECGWKERLYSWKEIVESEIEVGIIITFHYDNGLNLKFEEKEDGEAKLTYWFDNPESAVEVTSLQQLLELEH